MDAYLEFNPSLNRWEAYINGNLVATGGSDPFNPRGDYTYVGGCAGQNIRVI